MVGCGLLAGLVLFGYIVVRLISTFGKGDPPAIDALSPLIPPVLVDSARAMGALTDRDTLLYVFAPHSHGLADAFFVTNRDMVAVKGGVIKRYAIADDYDLDLRLTPGHGYLLVNLPARQLADTVYSTLSGLELQVMTLSLKRVFALLRK
jgi:hypothetical protein